MSIASQTSPNQLVEQRREQGSEPIGERSRLLNLSNQTEFQTSPSYRSQQLSMLELQQAL